MAKKSISKKPLKQEKPIKNRGKSDIQKKSSIKKSDSTTITGKKTSLNSEKQTKNIKTETTVQPLKKKKFNLKFAVFTSILTILSISTGAIFYLLMTDKLMFRAPMLYSKKTRITFTYGDVSYRENATAKWQKAAVGAELGDGYEIQTQKKSKADIRFSETLGIRIEQETHFVINQSNIYNKDMTLKRGAMIGKFKKEFQDQNIQIKTPTAVAGVRGTELGFEVSEYLPENSSEPNVLQATTLVYVISGIIEVENPQVVKENSMLLSDKSFTKIDQNNAPEDPKKIPENLEEDFKNQINAIHMEDVLLITEKILFEFNKAELKKESYQELDRIAKILKDRSEIIRIEGHTDKIGSASVNYHLSFKRAKAIREYLISKDISKKRLLIKAYGSTRPIVPNNSASNRAINRRVEFIIVK